MNKSRQLPATLDLSRVRAEAARRSLRRFIAEAWPVVEPSTPFVPGWHLDAIADHLEAVARGEIRNLLINVPPRHMKSLAVSVFFPCWLWASRPETRFLFASYAASLSIRDSLKCRRLIESPWYQRAFGSVFKLAGDQNLKARFDNDRSGYRIATSVGGAVTGEGGDVLAVDDPHSVNEAESDVIRQGVLDWHDTVFSTRANDPKRTARIIVMQRVHESDLAGHVLAQGGWTHLRLPAEYDGDRCVTSIGWQDPRGQDGELLWPTRFGEKELATLKEQLGSYAASGQLQQRPTPAEGGIFKKEWFTNRYRWGDNGVLVLDALAVPLDNLRRFLTVDLAASLKTTADYTVIAAWGVLPRKPSTVFLLDVLRKRMEGPDIEPAIERMLRRWNAAYASVEKVGFQLALIQQMKRNGVAVREYEPDKDKVSRAMAVTPACEAGRVVLPVEAPWLEVVEHELFSFPKGAFDDIVDNFSAMGRVLMQGSVGVEGDILPDLERRAELNACLPQFGPDPVRIDQNLSWDSFDYFKFGSETRRPMPW